MATHTFGTNATNSLTALKMNPANAQADVATVYQGILSDGLVGVSSPDVQSPFAKGAIWPGAWELDGALYIPNRGVLRVFQGDVVAIDSQGWPILVSANSAANAAWTFV